MFVLNSEKGYVTRYDSSGGESEKFGTGEVTGASRIAYSAENGDIYVTDEAQTLSTCSPAPRPKSHTLSRSL